jgi:hypothetical protein
MVTRRPILEKRAFFQVRVAPLENLFDLADAVEAAATFK